MESRSNDTFFEEEYKISYDQQCTSPSGPPLTILM
jgi:hypothetical protein